MRRVACGMALALALAGCHRHAASGPAAAQGGAFKEIAWREGDVDDAFAEAREANKPVLLYWGAKWCPPCNLMKQTLFKDPAFIAETANFVPVHLDGDSKGAQLWGEQFGIAGYPTVIILRPDRSEVTRLTGGGAAATLAGVLKLTATRTTSTEDLLKRADDPKSLSADDWKLLASYDWFDDPKHFGDAEKEAALLARLAAAAPDPAVRRHLALVGLGLSAGSGDVARLSPEQLAQFRAILQPMLTDYEEVKANRQELYAFAPAMIRALPDAAERKALGDSLIVTLDRVAADPALPLSDRLGTLQADIALSKGENGGRVSPAVLAKVRGRVAAVDKAADNPMLRQAVMPNAGSLLDDAGDNAGATKLLTAELPHAIAPYYFMVDLANFAEERKDKRAAIAWMRKAAETAQGPATRIQCAIFYAN